MPADIDRWNHNIAYYPVVLAAVPAHARDALDVGCGEGMLTRRLAGRVPRVVGIDSDPAGIAAARAAAPPGAEYVLGDVLTHTWPAAPFDVVCSVATLHHLDAAPALTRLAELVRPGGVLVVVGCARVSGPVDVVVAVAGAVAHRVLSRRHGWWEHPSPVLWPPPVTYREMRRVARRVVPGARFRRRLLWRYTLVWRRPTA